MGSITKAKELILKTKKSSNRTKLNLNQCSLTDIEKDIPELFELENLDSLDLSNNKLKNISGLSKLKNLKVLNLACNNITDISELSKLLNLKVLHIYCNYITLKYSIINLVL